MLGEDEKIMSMKTEAPNSSALRDRDSYNFNLEETEKRKKMNRMAPNLSSKRMRRASNKRLKLTTRSLLEQTKNMRRRWRLK